MLARIGAWGGSLVGLALLSNPAASQTPIYTVLGKASGDRLGYSVGSIGDIDGDGFGDFLVGTPGDDTHGPDAGTVSAHAGSTGIAIRVWWGEASGDGLGVAVAGPGDLDADGIPDAIAGAPSADSNGANAGRVLALSGAPAGGTLFGVSGLHADDALGYSVAGVGDVDADGIPDLAAGAPGGMYPGAGNGYVRVYSGVDGSVLHTLSLPTAKGFGYSVTGPGDLDGDGHADVAVGGAWPEVHVFSGASGASILMIDDCLPGCGSGCSGYCGAAPRIVAGVGDLDGDGIGDLAIGAKALPSEYTESGHASVRSGATGALLYEIPQYVAPGGIWVPGGGEDQVGRSLSGVPDVDGDGIPEVATGGFRLALILGVKYWPLYIGPGFMQLCSGVNGSRLFKHEVGQPEYYYYFDSGSQHELFGAAVAGADVNGDGFGDVVTGQPGYGATDYYYYDGDGSALVLSGTPLGLSADVHEIPIAAGGRQTFALDAGPGLAGQIYWLVGSLSGTSPGLAVGGSILPLNPDAYLWFGISHPNQPPLKQSLGVLDVQGRANAFFLLPPGSDPALLHATVHHAYGVISPDGAVTYTSNAVPLSFADGPCTVPALGALDCNGNGLADFCDISRSISKDCDGNGVPDECDIALQPSLDCNGNGLHDACDIAAGTSPDCNGNGVPDPCDLTSGTSSDCDANGVPDDCQLDCDGDGVLDSCEIAAGTAADCNGNGLPDDCELDDCNGNGILDSCDLAAGTSRDADSDGVPDECKATLHVPGLFATIQAAIDAAKDGDQVVVADGEYSGVGNHSIRLHGKNILVRSASGPLHCTILPGGGDGGFVLIDEERPTTRIQGFTIKGSAGAGIRIIQSSPTIERCVIVKCNTNGIISGLYVGTGAAPHIRNCWIIESADSTDAAILVAGATSPGGTLIEHCTIAGNKGPGVLVSGPGKATVRHSIVWGNGGIELSTYLAGSLEVSWSDVQGGPSGATGSGVVWGSGNIALDPQFAATGLGPWDLAPSSPCRNAGDPSFAPAPGELDLLGGPRVLEGIVDLGGLEGSGFDDCDHDLVPDALAIAQGLVQDCDGNGQPDGCQPDCNANGVADACDIAAGASMDIDQDGQPDECQTILRVPSPEFPTISAALYAAADYDVVLLADGVYTGSGNKNLDFFGKAVTVKSENGAAACTIDCEGVGPAFLFDSGESLEARVVGLTIRNTSIAIAGGGAIRIAKGSAATIERCILRDHHLPLGRGGAIHLSAGNAIVRDTLFLDNSAKNGGAVYLLNNEIPPVTPTPTLTLVNCSFSGNSASISGGAVGGTAANLVLKGCILWGDGSPSGSELHAAGGTLSVTHSNVQGGLAGVAGGAGAVITWGPENLDVSPGYVDAVGGDLHLVAGSPCVDAGDPAFQPESGERDVDGERRVQGPAVDIGADERAAP